MGPKTDIKTEDLSLVQAAVDNVQCLGLPGGPGLGVCLAAQGTWAQPLVRGAWSG